MYYRIASTDDRGFCVVEAHDTDGEGEYHLDLNRDWPPVQLFYMDGGSASALVSSTASSTREPVLPWGGVVVLFKGFLQEALVITHQNYPDLNLSWAFVYGSWASIALDGSFAEVQAFGTQLADVCNDLGFGDWTFEWRESPSKLPRGQLLFSGTSRWLRYATEDAELLAVQHNVFY